MTEALVTKGCCGVTLVTLVVIIKFKKRNQDPFDLEKDKYLKDTGGESVYKNLKVTGGDLHGL